MNYPDYLYHYTSIETLALILNNRTICFNNLLYVDDMEEAETNDLGLFGKYVNISCWTETHEESIALWNMYTPDMHGVRIKMPVFPFKKYHYKTGQFHFKEDVDTYINQEKLYMENKGAIIPNLPILFPVEYTDDTNLLFPTIRTSNSPNSVQQFLEAKSLADIPKPINISYSLRELGRYKRSVWSFQKEWRYLVFSSPMGLRDCEPLSLEKQQEIIRRLENREQKAPYERFFLEIDNEAFMKMEILLGPKMTEAEKILVVALLEKHGLGDRWKESALRIR